MENDWSMAVPLAVDGVENSPDYWSRMRTRLQGMGCSRVFLTILGAGVAAQPVSYFKELVPRLRELGAFFRKIGIEPAIWKGHTFGQSGDFTHFFDDGVSRESLDFTSLVDADDRGKLYPEHGVFCPLDKDFQKYLCDALAALAESRQPLIMLDDDFRLGNHGANFGCFCELHMARFRKNTGLSSSGGELACRVRTEPELRRLWCENNAQSLYEIAGELGWAVHAVSPETRLGICTSPQLRSGDGVDGARLATLLNEGKTRPFIRGCGAPYWSRTAEHIGAIEFSRQQREWVRHVPEIEVFAEGDTFPQRTFCTAAASLEAFDEGLTAAGFPGILSYQFSYGENSTSDPAFEKLTVERKEFHRQLRDFSPAEWAELGFAPAASESGFLARDPELTPWSSFVTSVPALEVLPRLGVPCAFGNAAMPVILAGEECAAFSDAELDAMLARGAVIDAPAAEALLKRKIDLGIAELSRLQEIPATERYSNRVSVPLYTAGENILWNTQLRDDADIQIYTTFGADIPGVLHITTRQGKKIVFLPWSMERAGGLNFFYERQQQFNRAFIFLTEKELPVSVKDQADIHLHLRCSPDSGEIAATVQNLSLDTFKLDKLLISKEFMPVFLLTDVDGLQELKGALPQRILQPMQIACIRLKKAW